MHFNINQLKAYFIAGSQNTNNNVKELLSIVEQACANGITMFQYREKDNSKLSRHEKFKVAKEIQEITHKYNVPLIIDDDLGLAKQIDTDGIHVGQNDENINKIIQEMPNKIIGLSVNKEKEILDINGKNINYIGIGPIYGTKSKANIKKPIGIHKLNKLASISNIPSVAIGGINERNIHNILKTKVSGIAVISEIIKSKNIKSTIKNLKEVE